MEINKILSADLLDLIFDERNKAYGAYELRRTYNRRIKRSLVFTFSVVGLVLAGSVLANSMKKSTVDDFIVKEVTLVNIEEEQPEPLPEPEPPQQEQEQPRTRQFTQFVVAPNEVVDQPPPEITDLDGAKIDVKTTEGTDYTGEIIPDKPEGADKGIFTEKIKVDESPVRMVQVQASYEGWEKFLLKNLRAEVPVDNGAPTGRHTVVIEFVVDVDGSVSDIKALSNVGYGMEDEAIRVIKKSKKWIPAFQYDRQVKAYRSQKITFEVLNDE